MICRVFKKKNLFKVGNEGGSSINSDQQLSNTLNASQARTFMHRDNQYLPRQHHNNGNNQATFEPELALHHYSHMPAASQYSLFQSQSLLPTHKPLGYDYSTGLPSEPPPIMVKQLMSNPRDCESGSENLQYQACESGLEVGTCESAQQMVTGRDEGMNEWAMLNRLVTSQLGNEDPSKGMRFEDANTSSVPQINQLSLRGEMDFWGYGK